MAYSGPYRVKNKGKYKGDPTKVVYRSMWEKYVFNWCDNNPDVTSWSSEEIVIPYYYDVDKRYHRYFPDIFMVYKGQSILIEIKPDKETKPPTGARKTKKYINEAVTYVKNMNKWEAAQSYCDDRKWKFQIWTEHTLQSMGLMPKPQKKVPGKLKPLKPYSKKRKK